MIKRSLLAASLCFMALLGSSTAPLVAEVSKIESNLSSSFPIIFYSVTNSDNAFENAKALGATHVHAYHLGVSIEEDQVYFDRAARFGMKVMANLNGITRLQNNMGTDDLRRYASHYKNHPALGFWYLYDEPDRNHVVEELQPLHTVLKEVTPEVPVAIAHSWTENWTSYDSVQDIIMNDIYPVMGQPYPHSSLHVLTNFTREALAHNAAVYPVLQAMNWTSFATHKVREKSAYKPEDIRFPNRDEMRYMSFAPMAMGVQGLAFFSYHHAMEKDPKWMKETLSPVVLEVRQFAEEVRQATHERILRAEDDELYLGIWKGKEEHWIVLANGTSSPRTIFRNIGKSIQGGRLTPWGASRDTGATLEKGTLVTQLEPWEVLIWKVKGVELP